MSDFDVVREAFSEWKKQAEYYDHYVAGRKADQALAALDRIEARAEAIERVVEAARDALSTTRRCAVCDGVSPSWDGHDKNPLCVGAAREALAAALDSLREEEG